MKQNEWVIDGSHFRSISNTIRGLSIPGSQLGNEPAHNAFAYGANEFGMIIDKEKIFFGNNGKSINTTDVIEFVVKTGKTAEHRPTETGYWGVGGTKITPSLLGVPAYVATIQDNEYVVFDYCYKGVDVTNLTKKDWNTIAKNGCTIKRRLVSKDEYEELTYSKYFQTPVNYGMGIHLYSKGTSRIDKKGIIANLDTTFSSYPNFDYFIKDIRTGDGKGSRFEGNTVYFPTLGKDNKLISDVRKLPKIGTFNYNDSMFSVYYYKHLHEGDKQWDLFEKKIEAVGGEIWQPYRKKDSSCHTNIWNHQLLHLLSNYHDKVQSVIYNYHTFHFVLESGEIEFGVIKNQNIDEVLLAECAAWQIEYITKNSLQHTGNKLEPVILENMKNSVTDETDGMNADYIKSLGKICNHELTTPELQNNENHKQTILDTTGEKDWIISKNGIPLIVIEGQLGNLDYLHTRQLFWQTAAINPKYAVILFEGNVNSKENKNKRDSFREALNDNTIKNLELVWFINIADFKAGTIANFEKIEIN
jgi:hypothetical protein